MRKETIYTLWRTLISRKRAGTARSYQDALTRFQKDNGTDVSFEDITPEAIAKWRNIMLEKLSRTTANIYLRTFSAVLHVAYELQLTSIPPKNLFRGLSIFSPNSSNSRRHYYLPSSEWNRMWSFYNSRGKNYPQTQIWPKPYLEKYLEALGLMIFMYLAGGMNLRDLCMLRYDKFYFLTGKKQLQFCRHKIADRINRNVELPIQQEMQMIMDRQGQQPKEGELIFPYLRYVIGDDEEENKATARLGQMIGNRMKKICQTLSLPCNLTPTWARHSFATNLIHAGVPKDYVAWAMAHTNNNTTSRYIASYSFEQMLEYNTLLLYPRGCHEHILAQIECLTEEEKE